MKVIKRNGQEEDFCLDKIKNAIKKANKATKDNGLIPLTDDKENKVVSTVQKKLESFDKILVEDIQEMVEDSLIKHNCYDVAKCYIKYRENKKQNKKFSDDEEKIISVLNGTNESVKQDNANKNPELLSTQRDYMAGTKSKTIVRKTWSKRIMDLHDKGVLHVHDTDYRAMKITNCFMKDTEFITSDGIKKFSNYKDGDKVLVKDLNGVFREATIHYYGKQKMQKVTFAFRGGKHIERKEVICTPNHRWYLQDGSVTENLSVGDYLYHNKKEEFDLNKLTYDELKMWCFGFIIGDDSSIINKKTKINYNRIRLCGDKNKYSIYFEKCGYHISTIYDNGDKEYIINSDFIKNDFINNKLWIYLPLKSQQSLFMGYYSADSYLNKDGISTSNLYIANMINDISFKCGYYVLSCKEEDKSTNFGNIHLYTFRFYTNTKENYGWHVEKIEPYYSWKEYDCWCLEEPITHTFTLADGLITGNCCLINLKDMLKDGFMLNGTFITTPSLFSIASNHASQIALHVSSSQYGGQTMSWSHISKYVHSSRVIFRHQNIERIDDIIEFIPTKLLKWIVKKLIRNKKVVDILTAKDVYRDIKKGVKTFQYQVNTISGTNGQSPFISMAINFAECENEEHKEDLYLVAKEIFRQRIKGILGSNKQRVSSLFPKILYFLDEDTSEGGKYFNKLMPLICECENERMSPDFISSKVQKKLKGVKVAYPCMGCRSFLTTEGSYFENGIEKRCDENFYGRHNNGVITINLPYVALESKKEYENGDKSKSLKEIFFEKLNDYLEIIYKDGFVQTYKHLKGTKAKVAPILWMWGGLTRKNAEDTIDDVICGWRSTYSLGYVGLWETSIAIINKNHLEDKSFAIEVLEFFNKKHNEWHKILMEENNPYSFLNTSSYGTPEESTTEKFANALKRDFDEIEGVNDHNYVTNSYHIIPSYKTKDGRGIDAYHKLEHESQFLSLSTGGAVSYVEIADMSENLDVIESVINYMYNTILYAEFNIRKDICYNCGFKGEIGLIKKDGKLIWKCPSCGNTNEKNMSILRRCCGYVFDASAGACQGRLSDINARMLNLGGGRSKDQNGNLIL